jgi:hypothetical protein
MKRSNKPPLVVDCEVYPNYFLAKFKNIEDGRMVSIEARGPDDNLSPTDRGRLKSLLYTRATVGFNSMKFDIPVMLAAIQGFTCRQIKAISDDIIQNNLFQWQTMKKYYLELVRPLDHVDLESVAPGVMVSLKLYGGRLHSTKLQDLPYDPALDLHPQQMIDIDRYCENDLDTTIDLYLSLTEDLELRDYMSTEYGIDLRSKGGAQIAEAIVKQQFNVGPSRARVPRKVSYQAPDFIEFNSDHLKEILAFVNEHSYTVDKSGYVKLPAKLTKPFDIGSTTYKMGIGGLHSQERNMVLHNVVDSDVTSYYPAIILNNDISPPMLGPAFLTFYKGIFTQRIRAKREGQMMQSNSLKLVLNSVFGKLSNRWSCMYDPEGMLKVTLTGQLALLMLIEKLEEAGINVYSANTDGVVHDHGFQGILDDWQEVTGFGLESNNYKSLYSRDVNNYIAIQEAGKVKRKGVFAKPGLAKNPAVPIVYESVVRRLVEDTPLADTIRARTSIQDYITVRRVNGGAAWKGQYLGKVVRFIWTTDGEKIVYCSNGNKVPTSDGSTPVMEFDGTWPENLDYQRYIDEAQNILDNLGVV